MGGKKTHQDIVRLITREPGLGIVLTPSVRITVTASSFHPAPLGMWPSQSCLTFCPSASRLSAHQCLGLGVQWAWAWTLVVLFGVCNLNSQTYGSLKHKLGLINPISCRCFQDQIRWPQLDTTISQINPKSLDLNCHCIIANGCQT